MTKPVTAVAAMILVEEGKLSLDDPVSKYLPEIGALPVAEVDAAGAVVGARPQREPMRVRHLLSFSSGIGGASFATEPLAQRWREEGLYGTPRGSLAERVDRLAALPLVEDPGTRWRYGSSLDVMARIVEIVADEDLGTFMERRIFTPLGMHATRYGRDTPADAPIATMYTEDADGELVPASTAGSTAASARFKAADWTPGGSGLVSTAPDYMRFALMLWNEGTYAGVRILAPETVRRMRQLEVPSGVLADLDIEGLGFGLGVGVIVDEANATMPGRDGDYFWLGAYGTHFWISPSTGVVLVTMQQFDPPPGGAGTPLAPFLVQALALVDR